MLSEPEDVPQIALDIMGRMIAFAAVAVFAFSLPAQAQYLYASSFGQHYVKRFD